jgi:hypothetical protein
LSLLGVVELGFGQRRRKWTTCRRRAALLLNNEFLEEDCAINNCVKKREVEKISNKSSNERDYGHPTYRIQMGGFHRKVRRFQWGRGNCLPIDGSVVLMSWWVRSRGFRMLRSEKAVEVTMRDLWRRGYRTEDGRVRRIWRCYGRFANFEELNLIVRCYICVIPYTNGSSA